MYCHVCTTATHSLYLRRKELFCTAKLRLHGTGYSGKDYAGAHSTTKAQSIKGRTAATDGSIRALNFCKMSPVATEDALSGHTSICKLPLTAASDDQVAEADKHVLTLFFS